MAEIAKVYKQKCAGMSPLDKEDRIAVRHGKPAPPKRDPYLDYESAPIQPDDPYAKIVHIQHFTDGRVKPICPNLTNDHKCQLTIKYLPAAFKDDAPENAKTWTRSKVFAACCWCAEPMK